MGLVELDYQNRDLSFLRYQPGLQEHGKIQDKIEEVGNGREEAFFF